MATIKKQGKGYKISVSHGYDINGKQLRAHMTWVPPAGTTARQLEKELQRQAVLFEEQVRHSITHDENIKLVDFTALFLKEYAYPTLKAKTAYGYEQRMAVLNQALGHIKLKDLKPGHIIACYANLQEKGMRKRVMAAPKIDFAAWMRERKTNMAALARSTGLSVWTFKQLRGGNTITQESAQKVAAALGVQYDHFFTTQRDMTPLKPGTIHDFHRVLSAVLGRAIKWGYIKEAATSRVDLPLSLIHI